MKFSVNYNKVGWVVTGYTSEEIEAEDIIEATKIATERAKKLSEFFTNEYIEVSTIDMLEVKQ